MRGKAVRTDPFGDGRLEAEPGLLTANDDVSLFDIAARFRSGRVFGTKTPVSERAHQERPVVFGVHHIRVHPKIRPGSRIRGQFRRTVFGVFVIHVHPLPTLRHVPSLGRGFGIRVAQFLQIVNDLIRLVGVRGRRIPPIVVAIGQLLPFGRIRGNVDGIASVLNIGEENVVSPGVAGGINGSAGA